MVTSASQIRIPPPPAAALQARRRSDGRRFVRRFCSLQSDRVDVGYATIFPSMTIVKAIAARVVVGLLAGTAAD
jgi:hypothetical protein